MALKEPKSMAEIHAIREKLSAKMKRMNVRQKLAWIEKQAKMIGISEESVRLRKAS